MPRRDENLGFAAIQTLAPAPQSDKERSMALAEKLIAACVRKYDADIVGLPELFATPFFPFTRERFAFKLAEGIPGPTTDRFCKLAHELGVFLITPIFERTNELEYFDSSPIISPNGDIVGVYRKSSIPETAWRSEGVVNHEKYFFHPGDGIKVFDLGLCKLGQLICYDRHFPEAWRTLSSAGAEVIYIPNASVGNTMSEMFILETRAMSVANGVFSVVSNRRGKEGAFSFFGGTHIVDPEGTVLAGPIFHPNDVVFSKLDLELLRKKVNSGRSIRLIPRVQRRSSKRDSVNRGK